VLDVRLDVVLDTDADDQALARLGAMTERYCVVARSLAEPPSLKVRRTRTAR